MGRKKTKVFVSAGDVDAELGIDAEKLKNSEEEQEEKALPKTRRSPKREGNKEDSLVDDFDEADDKNLGKDQSGEDVDKNEVFGEESETEGDDFADDGDGSDDFDETDDSDEFADEEDNGEDQSGEDVDENEVFGEESETEDDDFTDDGDRSDDFDETDDSDEFADEEDNGEDQSGEDVDENEVFGEESETEDDDFTDDGDGSDDFHEADDGENGNLYKLETGDAKLGEQEENVEASRRREEASAKNKDFDPDGGKIQGEVADETEEEELSHEENEVSVNKVPTEQKLAEPVLKETKQRRHEIALKSGDLNVTLTFETGRQKMTLGELETIGNGYTFVCENPIEGPVEIRANGTLIGYGQLVDVEGKFGVQITEFTKNVNRL